MPHIGAGALLGVERKNLGVAFDCGLDGMRRRRFAKARCDLRHLRGVERLATEEQHLVFEQRGANSRHRCLVDAGFEHDVADDGA